MTSPLRGLTAGPYLSYEDAMHTHHPRFSWRSFVVLVVGTAAASGCIAKGNFPERSAKVYCDKLKECDPENYDLVEANGGCEDQAKAAAEDSLDQCDDYKGGLAYKCLQQAKKQSCEDFNAGKSLSACDDFNDACGFNDGTAIVEYEGGFSVYGYMDYQISCTE